jgi:hypothetical protein
MIMGAKVEEVETVNESNAGMHCRIQDTKHALDFHGSALAT